MQGIKQSLNLLGSALSIRGRRNEIIASNIANAATPHFKARDIDFSTEISRYQTSGPLKTSHEAHIPIQKAVAPGKVQYRENLSPSLDGNTVELAVEQLEFSENAMRYQATLQFLNGRISTLMSAIRGE